MQSYKSLIFLALFCHVFVYSAENPQPLVVTQDDKDVCIWLQLPALSTNAQSWILYAGAPENTRTLSKGTMEETKTDKIVTRLRNSIHTPLIVLRFFDSNNQPSATYLQRIDSPDWFSARPSSESSVDKWIFMLAGGLLTILGGFSSSKFQSRLQKQHERDSKHGELRQAVIEQSAIVFSSEMLTEVDSNELQELIRRTAALSFYDKRASSLQNLLVEIMILHSGNEFVDDRGRFQQQYDNARVQWVATTNKWS